MPKKVPQLASAPTPLAPYSVVTEANGFVFLSGQVAIDRDGNTPEGIQAQARVVMENIGRVLRELGLGYSDIVKTTVFLTDIGDFSAFNEVYGGFFDGEPPARTALQVAALPRPQFRVEVEAVVAR